MLPKFSSRAFLAPMAGVSDPALRLQCKQMGAGLVVTEFTNIHSIIAKENQLYRNLLNIQIRNVLFQFSCLVLIYLH
jgi:tRNA-dihydrouridine synthase